eukprot:7678657-Karenia_brevis.AAC.1
MEKDLVQPPDWTSCPKNTRSPTRWAHRRRQRTKWESQKGINPPHLWRDCFCRLFPALLVSSIGSLP